MIIWVNGAFGVGKSHTAYELRRRLADAFLFDPEQVGFFLRKYLPNTQQFDDFQKNPLWQQQVLDDLLFCEKEKNLTIVPMTIIFDDVFEFIINGLKNNAIDVRHFTLIASKKTIAKRLTRRGNKNSWAFKQIDKCLDAFKNPSFATKIDTEKLSLDEVVEFIAKETNQILIRDRLNFIQKWLNWHKITLKSKLAFWM